MTPYAQPLGPLMLDVAGTALTDVDRARLTHPLCGGVIIFARNYESPEQVAALTAEIHALRAPPLLVAVDQEGGRVQRFREGFTPIPPMRTLGRLHDEHPHQATRLAETIGRVIGEELRSCGVDFTFAPVLDVDHGPSTVIGNRAFHADPLVITTLARALIRGLRQAGVSAVGKHFPGHGYVAADSHSEVPVDERSFEEIEACDLKPFARLVSDGLAAIMPAHVIYPRVDAAPAGFSTVWLKRVLRERLGFDGAVFSDDLGMAGAAVAGGMVERVRTALEAGCDMGLICNSPEAADEVLAGLRWESSAVALARLARMHGRGAARSLVQLREDAEYARAVHDIGSIAVEAGELALTGACAVSGGKAPA
ncbi:MAG TPA: beta-N-acetylhexosaminidase [Burkholderiales bacterium]|nr:beta-N-acetylhexosaminidase [Burkholderiales bacterium]